MSDYCKPQVFFDGNCPLCRREIDHYRRLRGADAIEWIDIFSDQFNPSLHQLSPQQAMAYLHVRDSFGQWQKGAYGFVEIWRHLPGYRWLGKVLEALRLVAVTDWVYARFASWRLRRRCQNGACQALSGSTD